MTATTLPGSVLLQNRLCYGVARNVIGVPNGIGWLLQCKYRLENSLSWNNQSSMTGGDLQFTNFT